MSLSRKLAEQFAFYAKWSITPTSPAGRRKIVRYVLAAKYLLSRTTR